ncbi:MAG TPA: ATP-binding protein [Candidatus Saccharimonadales bacterium]|nr:ATP-binding protein [Candidatus Saccharimonadales bacterium]
MFTLFVILAVFLQIAIAVGMYYRRRGGHTNTIFMFLSLALASWALANYFAITIPQNANTVYAIRVVIGLVVLQNTLFYFFAKTFPDKKFKQLKHRKLILYYSLFTLAVTQTPLLFQSVTIQGGTANPVPGPGMIFFVIHAVITIFGGLRGLIIKYRQARGIARRQLLLIIFASTVLWFIVPITNFAITLAAHTTTFVRFSPFYTLLFGAFITYAIVAQKLFDIRAAVARSVGYVLVLGTITFTYAVIFFGVIKVAFPGGDNELLRQILSTILIAPLVLAFQGVKRFFDRVTKSLFYRDSYDAQEVLDKLGSVTVAEIELQRILHRTRSILSEALKSSFVDFLLLKRENNASPHVDNIAKISEAFRGQHGEIIVTEDLNPASPVRKWLAANDIGLCLRLRTQKEVVGYLLLGDKKSGDIYSPQDTRLLLIIANELAVAIQNALRFEEIQNFNRTLQAKVDEATKKLRRANEKLRELDDTKDDFISMASHQLRTPLTSVKGYISMVLEGDAGKISSKQRDMLGQAFFSSQRMVYLIADLLNVSRLKTGKFVIESTPVNLAQVVKEELEQLQETAAAHSLKLSYDQPKKFPELMLDETKIRQVIMNFVDNAIYYTPVGGHITVHLVDKKDTVELRVEDDGIGVPKSEQPHLFTKFYRAGNARKARPDGTGLGLFMAKKVIMAQGGSLIFESQEGKGSTFGFVFSKSRLNQKHKQ